MTQFALPKAKKVLPGTAASEDDEKPNIARLQDEPVPPAPRLDYEAPDWSGHPQHSCYLEVLKGGAIVETIAIPMDREYLACGRLPTCDVPMEHPSISRWHAVIQFSRDGTAFVYDLGSTHGVFLNKQRIPARAFVKLEPGSLVRFGESTRLYIFHKEAPAEEAAVEPPEAAGEAAVIDDPLKALREWFEESGGGKLKFVSRKEGDSVMLSLTIPGEMCGLDDDLEFESKSSHRREAEFQISRTICERLIELGVMNAPRDGTTEWQDWKRVREEALAEEEDEFYDRTGKRPKSKTKERGEEEGEEEKSHTLSHLLQLKEHLQSQLAELSAVAPAPAIQDEEDEFESYMARMAQEHAAQEEARVEAQREHILEKIRRIDSRLESQGALGGGAAAPPVLPPPSPEVVSRSGPGSTVQFEDNVDEDLTSINHPEVTQGLKSQFGY